jgi:hypothetical protein
MAAGTSVRRGARRTLTITLTEAQYRALSSAVADHSFDLEDRLDQYDRPDDKEERAEIRGKMRALDNAWTKINRAWYSKGRK